MSKRSRLCLMPAILAATLAVATGACSKKSAGTSTATPTPAPGSTPNECEILFQTVLSTDGSGNVIRFNLYEIEMFAAGFVDGTATVTPGASDGDPSQDAVLATFGFNVDNTASPPAPEVAGFATAGSFVLGEITTQASNATFTFTGLSGLQFFALGDGGDAAPVGSGGASSTVVDGVLSPPDNFLGKNATDYIPFLGQVTVEVSSSTPPNAIVTSSLTIGGATAVDESHGNYAIAGCFDNTLDTFSPRVPLPALRSPR